MSSNRRQLFVNQIAKESFKDNDGRTALEFHVSLPGYMPSPLVSLPDLATELNIKQVLVKDESSRFGLPAFKILGASWGACQAIAREFGLPSTASLDELKTSLAQRHFELIAATDGNHGRAVAYVATMLGTSCTIVVPKDLDQHVKDTIQKQGGKVVDVDGSYDDTVKYAAELARESRRLLIQDTSWEGYEDVPRWIVEGYSTIFHELADQAPNAFSEDSVIITPVGVGSLAHAVVRACKSRQPNMKVVSVEPDTAACLYKSRKRDKSIPIETSFTIMTGMDCGTVTHTAFKDLQKYIDISLTVSDHEAHLAVQSLNSWGIESGPCGAAGVAAARRLRDCGKLNPDSTVILLNTESTRNYPIPFDVSTEDPVELTQILTRIESTNTTLSRTPGSGEKKIVDYIEAWLQHRDIEVHRVGSSARPSIIGRVQGIGNGKTLMINGHIDTVTLEGYAGDALSGSKETRDGREVVCGRGALDMKAGVAIGMCNLVRAKGCTEGDVILCAVADEEDASKGTEDVLGANWRADAAIIPEPTQMQLLIAHKGFVWVEVTIVGRAAHGSDPRTGIDAVMNAGYVLEALRRYASKLPLDEKLGQATMHCGMIRGGEENSTYPATCRLTVEFRTVPGQSSAQILGDINQILSVISNEEENFSYEGPRLLFERPFHSLDADHDLVKTFQSVSHQVLGRSVDPGAGSFWCDAALLGAKGIPTLVFGPSGQGLHGKDEYVHTDSILEVDTIVQAMVQKVCG